MWVAAGSDDFHYSEAMCNSYIECEEWLDWVCSLETESVLFTEAVRIRKLVPTVGWFATNIP